MGRVALYYCGSRGYLRFDTRYLVICIEIITSVSISPLLYRDHSHLLCISQISHPEPSIPKESFVVHIPNFASRSCAYDDEDEDEDEDDDDDDDDTACVWLLFNGLSNL